MSNGTPPDTLQGGSGGALPVLFIDRDVWSRKLHDALFAAAIRFEAHRDHFQHDALDQEWLSEVGARHWVVVTRDKAIRRRPNELAAVRAAKLHVFALTSGNLSAAESADIVIKAWPHICRAVAETPPPQLWSIDRSGRVRRIKV